MSASPLLIMTSSYLFYPFLYKDYFFDINQDKGLQRAYVSEFWLVLASFMLIKPICQVMLLQTQNIIDIKMEEASSNHIFKFDNLKPMINMQEVNTQPICLTKSKLKAMHGRIFWCRNNSESSLEKIKMKDKQQSPDKLKEYREHNSKLKYQLDDLVKKLCLPKIKQSTSLHSSCIRNTHQRKQTTYQPCLNNQNKKQSSAYIPRSKIKQKTSERKQVNQILEKYNQRCRQQIQEFTLSVTKNQKRFTQPYNLKKVARQKTRFDSSDTQNGYLPKHILKSLIKNIR